MSGSPSFQGISTWWFVASFSVLLSYHIMGFFKRSVRFVTPRLCQSGQWARACGVVPYCEFNPATDCSILPDRRGSCPSRQFDLRSSFPNLRSTSPCCEYFEERMIGTDGTCCLTWRWIRHCHGKLWRVPDISLEVIIRRHTLSSKYVAWGWANTREWRHTIWRGWVFWHRFMRATASKPNGEALTETRPHCKQIQKRCLGFGWNENRKERIQGAMVTITRNIQKAVEVRKCRGLTLEYVGKSWDKLDRPYVPEVSAPGPFILYAFDFLQCRSNVILLWSVW